MNSLLHTVLLKAKWLFLVIFLCGYALTFDQFDQRQAEYFFLNFAACSSCLLLLAQINIFNRAHSAAWVALTLLLMGYFVRFYWIAIDPMPVERMLPWNPFRTMIVDRDALFLSFKLSVAAFIAFNISALALVFYFGRIDLQSVRLPESKTGVLTVRSGVWLLAVLFLMALLAFVTYTYRIGEMGADSGTPLPFRLKGIVFYARTVCVPIFILMCIQISERQGDVVLSRAGMLVLLMHGVSDMLLRNSRSALLLSLLLLAFLVLSDGARLRRKEKVIFGLMAMAALVLVPVMTDYRQVRLLQNLSHVDALVSALNNSSGRWISQFFAGFKFVMFRMPGLESLWCELALGAKPLGLASIDVLRSKDGIAGYLTYVIHPMKESNNTLLAPGFVGWLYIVGGLPSIVAGSVFAAVMSVAGWRYLDVRYLRTGPVAQVFLLWILFVALTEGTLDSMNFMIVVGVLTLSSMEFFLRRSGARQSRGSP